TARSDYLRNACRNDDALRVRVEALLAVADGPSFLLDRPAAAWYGESGEAPPEAVHPSLPGMCDGSSIGPYKLVEAIGEGGMGTVSPAEQNDPVRRAGDVTAREAG